MQSVPTYSEVIARINALPDTITPAAIRVLREITHCIYKDNGYLTREQIAAELHIGKRTVSRAIAQLEETSILKVRRSLQIVGKNNPNRYEIDFKGPLNGRNMALNIPKKHRESPNYGAVDTSKTGVGRDISSDLGVAKTGLGRDISSDLGRDISTKSCPKSHQNGTPIYSNNITNSIYTLSNRTSIKRVRARGQNQNNSEAGKNLRTSSAAPNQQAGGQNSNTENRVAKSPVGSAAATASAIKKDDVYLRQVVSDTIAEVTERLKRKRSVKLAKSLELPTSTVFSDTTKSGEEIQANWIYAVWEVALHRHYPSVPTVALVGTPLYRLKANVKNFIVDGSLPEFFDFVVDEWTDMRLTKFFWLDRTTKNKIEIAPNLQNVAIYWTTFLREFANRKAEHAEGARRSEKNRKEREEEAQLRAAAFQTPEIQRLIEERKLLAEQRDSLERRVKLLERTAGLSTPEKRLQKLLGIDDEERGRLLREDDERKAAAIERERLESMTPEEIRAEQEALRAQKEADEQVWRDVFDPNVRDEDILPKWNKE